MKRFALYQLSYRVVKVTRAGLEPATTHILNVVPSAFAAKLFLGSEGVATRYREDVFPSALSAELPDRSRGRIRTGVYGV
jgi:hypothetical protein